MKRQTRSCALMLLEVYQVGLLHRWQQKCIRFSCYMQLIISLCERKYSFRNEAKLQEEERDERNVLMAVNIGGESWQKK